ncbi:AIRS C and AIRS and GARS N and Formyl trans N and GARS C and GARS A domain containing protein [Trichuris trichiura]|uniref:AIRS C and AIRS and GARS N and Formyl trans N and GARS C and GARS A domain containing protein n=1 Tax=Trichuris trichiura TaxID=36087 RepID=A0A077ZDU5_TRITR|nr:AIRS C and AIRS and GARS N and Formyl trans N and GARS C and GARS A domain containing protein [Trichuris trichiura]
MTLPSPELQQKISELQTPPATVLVIGGGGREHSITHKLVQSGQVGAIFASPGNAGIALLPKTKCIRRHIHSTCFSVVNQLQTLALDLNNKEAVCAFCKHFYVDLVVIGPEDYLASGFVDYLTSRGVKCFGPTSACATLEFVALKKKQRNILPSKKKNRLATAWLIELCGYKCWVVKAVGLTRGKGVHVTKSAEEACATVTSFLKDKIYKEAGSEIVLEEVLVGEEISALCFTDGESVEMMPLVQDYKRLELGDRGPNTGGMGSTCPYQKLTKEEMKFIEENIMLKVIKYMKQKGNTYKGVLYAGLIKTDSNIFVLEFNCRFGDPEAEVSPRSYSELSFTVARLDKNFDIYNKIMVLMPLLQSDLYEVMQSCVNGNLSEHRVSWRQELYTLGVVMASEGYPRKYRTGFPIKGLTEADDGAPGAVVYHCGTAVNDSGQIVTNGGRVLCVVGSGIHPSAAKLMAYSTVACIDFEGCFFRRDIGRTTLSRSLQGTHSNLASVDVYLEAGVDLKMAREIQGILEPLCRQTSRPGTEDLKIGGFGAFFDLESAGYQYPLLVSGTDGVGTKIKIAAQCGKYETIGIDLVAMSVNDILTHNAEPLFFLDYIAVNAIDFTDIEQIVKGMAEGCKQANCALIGGETAELPGLYAPGELDLAGFAVGALEKGRDLKLPLTEKSTNHYNRIKEGDVVLGLASSGIHSNGFSMIRKIIDQMNTNLNAPASWNHDLDFGSALLTPTKIYVKSLLPILRSGKVKAAVHVTGGGLIDNIPRVLPSQLGVILDALSWPIHDEFQWIAAAGDIAPSEMAHIFNCGIGMVLIVENGEVDPVKNCLEERGERCYEIGKVYRINPEANERQVHIRNLNEAFSKLPCITTSIKYLKSRKKLVAVLISGEGTNMVALVSYSKQHCSSYDVVLVISNKKDAAGLAKARDMGIPAQFIASSKKGTEDFENSLQQALVEYEVELICLAGFMQILSGILVTQACGSSGIAGNFLKKWVGRIVNIHPALLPLFKGLHPHRQALDAGVRVSGATVHFAEEEVDSGGIISQRAVPVYTTDSESTLSERIKQIEHDIYPNAVDKVARGFVRRISSNKVCWTH